MLLRFHNVPLILMLSLPLMAFVQTGPADALTTVQSVNTFLNVGQFGALLYLLWRSDSALMRQRSEQADERKLFLGYLIEAYKNRTQDEK